MPSPLDLLHALPETASAADRLRLAKSLSDSDRLAWPPNLVDYGDRLTAVYVLVSGALETLEGQPAERYRMMADALEAEAQGMRRLADTLGDRELADLAAEKLP